MATLNAQLIPLQITPGVQPETDCTALSTPHYTMSDKVRSYRGRMQKIGGWQNQPFSKGSVIKGVARTLYGAVINNLATTVIGTNSNLYSLYGQDLTNITPIDSASNAAPNTLYTACYTLGNNPFSVTSGSSFVTVTGTPDLYQVGDAVTFTGTSGFAGIPAGDFNTTHVIRSVTPSTYVISVNTPANATTTGGGASVVEASGMIAMLKNGHGVIDGDRIKITGSADVGGITAIQINQEFVARVPSPDIIRVITTGMATSLVGSGGGAGVAYLKKIAAGAIDLSSGIGYGVGRYGVSFYGTSRLSGTGITYPRLWFMDRFGDRIVMTPGNQGKIYIWDGSTATAPAVLSGAPTDVNYLFVSDNILVTFGHQNIPNQIFASDQGDATNWTASSLNQVYQDVIEGAGRFLSHVPVLGINLIFTQSQTYRFSKIDINAGVWDIKLLDNSVGIIAPMARVSVNNVAYWMANNNFYMWSGGNIQQIPSNTSDQCTMLKYVYENLNNTQSYKCFAWYNDIFNEIWFHYPSANSNECDRIARVSLSDFSWTPDTMDRVCAEYPDNLFLNPRLISLNGTFYNHERGYDADTSPMPFSLTSNLRSSGKEGAIISGFVPDSIQTGTINVNLSSYQWPQSSAATYTNDFTVSDSAPRIDTQIGGRFWQYNWSGSDAGQKWIMGQWNELVQKGSAN